MRGMKLATTAGYVAEGGFLYYLFRDTNKVKVKERVYKPIVNK